MPPPTTTGLRDAGPQDWYRDIPIITKLLLTTTFLLGAFTTFGILSPYSLVLMWPMIFNKFEIWRLFTSALFAGQFSFPFAIHLYMLYNFSLRYEANIISTGARGTAADYLWMLLICTSVLWAFGYIFDFAVLSGSLLFSILYVWSRNEPDSLASIFGFKFKAIYLPWMYIAFKILVGDSFVGLLLGIAAGIAWNFLNNLLS